MPDQAPSPVDIYSQELERTVALALKFPGAHRIEGRAYSLLEGPPSSWRIAHLREAVHIMQSSPPIRSLEFLSGMRVPLRHLIATDYGIEDLSAINDFTALRTLSVWPSADALGKIELQELPKLLELAIPSRFLAPIVAEHPLKKLLLEGRNRTTRRDLVALTSLESLRLDSYPVPSELPASLRELSVGGLRWPAAQQPIFGIEGVEQLELVSIRGMRDLNAFCRVHSLRRLYLEDCDELESLSGPALSADAEVILVGRDRLGRPRGRQ